MKNIFIILSIIAFAGCAGKDPKAPSEIYDLVNIPQDAGSFLKDMPQNLSYYDIQKKFEENYFSPWKIEKLDDNLTIMKWPFDSYRAGDSYGENLKPLKQTFFDEMLYSSNFESFSSVNEKALVLKETNIRAFPTTKPLLKDPSLAGEGFPFDYLQNSTIYANKPIFVSHYSKNREWAFIVSSFTAGWIKADEFVVLGKKHIDEWQKAQQVRIVKENIDIYSDDGKFLFSSKIGMMFALAAEDNQTYTILTVSAYRGNKPEYIKSKISKTVASKEILKLNSDNLTSIINEVSSTNYGWGGVYEQRDCSSMLRDIFAPFGIWLPRNSYRQSKIGKVVDFDGMSDEDKIKLIKEQAVPFETLLYKRGHIVLYVGTYNDEVIIFHNTWGIKTKKNGIEGRVIIGKPVFSTLRLGKDQRYYNEDAEILKNLKSMNILTQ